MLRSGNAHNALLVGSLEERNIRLASLFMQFVLADKELQKALPTEASVVIIPVFDPELAKHNLEIAKTRKHTLRVVIDVVEEAPDQVEVYPLWPRQTGQRFQYA